MILIQKVLLTSLVLVLQVLATQACGIKLAFSMCLLQCVYCTDEAHNHINFIDRNRAHCLRCAKSFVHL